ncbi:MAG: hypothetical protein M9930_10690 [Anaerolineae bacterium]|nr:hypothetical protein [Anaerolineae bacterium]
MKPRKADGSAHWAKVMFGVVALVVVFGVIAVLAGVFDPPLPRCPLPTTALTLAATTEEQTTWLDPLPSGAMGVRLTAMWRDGEQDAGYGVLLGSPESYVGVAVSPLGYMTVWQSAENKTITLLPWQPWVHVKRAALPNEFWFDWHNGELTVRLNREIAWQMPFTGVAAGELQSGVWATTFGEPVTVSFADQFVTCR